MIHTLQAEFPNVPIGYSGHETGLQTTLAAVAMGAVFVERHITLDRAMWGSDQAASVEPQGLQRLVRDIRVISRRAGRRGQEGVPGRTGCNEEAAPSARRAGRGSGRAGLCAVTHKPAGGALALVEGPSQLLNVVEAGFRIPDLVGAHMAILAPTAGPTRNQLRVMAGLAREAGHELFWYEPRHSPAAVARTVRTLAGQLREVDRLVVGDPFSGVIQLILTLTRFRRSPGPPLTTALRRWSSRACGPRRNRCRGGTDGGHRGLPGRWSPPPGTGWPAAYGVGWLDGGLRIFTALPVVLPGVEVVQRLRLGAVALAGA